MVCLEGESTEWKGSSVFLAKTPTSFRRPYVWSARIVLQERLRRLMIFAKLKPLVSYMIIPKTHVAAVLDWTLPFYGEMQEICTVCVNIYICVCVCIYIYAGAGHIIRISSKSLFISLIPFKKWNLYNVYIHSTQTDIFQVFISFNFDDYDWQLIKTPNSVSQKIRILLKTNTKKGFLEILANWKVWTWKVWACTALNT